MFDPNKLYFANDPALNALAPYSTMAHWRCEGRGPAFIKIGSRVAYSGKAPERLARRAHRRTCRRLKRNPGWRAGTQFDANRNCGRGGRVAMRWPEDPHTPVRIRPASHPLCAK